MVTLFWRMLTGREAFLEPLGVSGLRSCARTRIKKALSHSRPVGGTFNKYQLPPSAGLGHTSVSRVGRYTYLAGCVLVSLAVGPGRLT